MENIQIVRNEKPNSYEFGRAGNRFKLYFDTIKELKQKIKELKDEGLIEEDTELSNMAS